MKKETILDTLSFIVGLVTILLVVFFKDKMNYLLFSLAIGGSLFGIILIMKKSNYGYLITSLGISLLGSVLLYRFNILDRPDAVTFMITGSVFSLMVISMIFSVINDKVNKKECSLLIYGEVVDLVKNSNTKDEYFQPIYEYVVDDKPYQVAYPKFLNKKIPDIGSKHKIYVNPKKHEDVYFEKEPIDKLYDYGISLLLAIVSLIIIITLFV